MSMFVKKLSLILALIVSIFYTTVGCSDNLTNKEKGSPGSESLISVPLNSTPQATPAKEASTEINLKSNPEESTSVVYPLITKAGGLGDTKEAIEKERGSDELGKDITFSSYQNKTISVMYTEDDVTKRNIAFNVSLQFEATDKVRRTKEEAIKEAELVIPKDALKVKEYVADEGRDVIQYKSKLLAERLRWFYELESSADSEFESGTFIVILKYDDQGVFAVITGPGNNP